MPYKYPDTKFTAYSYYINGLPLQICLGDKKEVNPKEWEEVFKHENKKTIPAKAVGLIISYLCDYAEISISEAEKRVLDNTRIANAKNNDIKELQEKIKQLQEEVKKAKQFELKF